MSFFWALNVSLWAVSALFISTKKVVFQIEVIRRVARTASRLHCSVKGAEGELKDEMR